MLAVLLLLLAVLLLLLTLPKLTLDSSSRRVASWLGRLRQTDESSNSVKRICMHAQCSTPACPRMCSSRSLIGC
jgi:hypothetical protein